MKAWAESVLDGAEVLLTPPGPARNGPGLSLYLMRLVPEPPARGLKRPPLQLKLHYLVTAAAEDPERAHRLLGQMVFAAMAEPDMEIAPDPLPLEAWTAFGAEPRPSFTLVVPLRLERPQPETQLVRRPLVAKAAPLVGLFGLVLGPEDIPLAGARVDLPDLNLSQRTDRRGRFHFASIPGESRATSINVIAKGRRLPLTVDHPTSKTEPVVVRFDSFE